VKWDDPETSVDWRRQVAMLVLERVEVASARRVGRDLRARVDPEWKA